VHRNINGLEWDYPSNVQLITYGKSINVRIAERVGLLKKIIWYLSFTLTLFKVLKKNKGCVFLVYDYMPLLAYRLISKLVQKPIALWYHNHDVADPELISKYSISWFAWKSENWIFPKLDIFSLPSLDRKKYFPINKLKGNFYYLPNFPSQIVFKKFYNYNKEKEITDKIKILFHGSIGSMHGLEEIIEILHTEIQGKKIELVLKGFISSEYKEKLKGIAIQNNVENQLIFIEPSGLKGVIENTQNCHIGIGIYRKDDIMNNTVGTASNKIYEYAAAGMPVLLFDNEYFKTILKDKEWAFFTDTSKKSLLESIKSIVVDYSLLSSYAINDFNDKLCFEYHFNNALNAILK